MRIAVLLHNPVNNDARVIKTIRVLSSFSEVSLFYINGSAKDAEIFVDGIQLHSVPYDHAALPHKITAHTNFQNQFEFLGDQVLATKIKFDWIWANDLPTLKPALKVSNILRCKLAFDAHEIYTETLNQFFPKKQSGVKGFVSRHLLTYMNKAGSEFEREAVKKVDLFITVNKSLADYFEATYQVRGVAVMMNCPESAIKQVTPVDLRNKFGWDSGASVFIYQGMLNQGRNLEGLVDAFMETSEDCKLVILGDGVLKPRLVQKVKLHGGEGKIVFQDRVPYSQLPSWTAGADFGVSLLEPLNLSKKMASPNKLFEYIHAGIPVLTTASKESLKILKEFDIGLTTDNSYDDLVQKLEKLKDSRNAISYARACSDAADKYNWESQSGFLQGMLTREKMSLAAQ